MIRGDLEGFMRGQAAERLKCYLIMMMMMMMMIIIIIIIIIINCNWVVTRWQWLFYMQTKHKIGYY